jgi:hypothetical protein
MWLPGHTDAKLHFTGGELDGPSQKLVCTRFIVRNYLIALGPTRAPLPMDITKVT